VLGQCLPDPGVLTVLGPDDEDEVVACSVIAVQKVGDEPHQAQAPREDDELIFGADLLEEILLEFLDGVLDRDEHEDEATYQRE
jgi:hypothetical protein